MSQCQFDEHLLVKNRIVEVRHLPFSSDLTQYDLERSGDHSKKYDKKDIKKVFGNVLTNGKLS